jgi:hypothetical protein
VYQLDVQGSYDGSFTGMCNDVAMAESWEGVGEAAIAKTHKAQDGPSGGVRCSHWR